MWNVKCRVGILVISWWIFALDGQCTTNQVQDWSAPTSGVRIKLTTPDFWPGRVGIYFKAPDSSITQPVKTDLYVPVPIHCSMRLVDEKGNEVFKRTSAKNVEKALKPLKFNYYTQKIVKRVQFSGQYEMVVGNLELYDLFVIQRETDYVLEVVLHVYQDSNGDRNLTPINLDPVKVRLHLKPSGKTE
jgi:hypothetical protein